MPSQRVSKSKVTIVNSVTSKLQTEGFMTFINVSYLSDAKRINKARDNLKNSCLDHVI